MTLVYFYKKKKTRNKNKTPEQTTGTFNKVKISNSVIELHKKFQNVENDKNCSAVPVKEVNLYNTFVNLIKTLEELPKSEIIEKRFNIDKRTRLKIYNELSKKGYLINLGNGKGFKINPNLDLI